MRRLTVYDTPQLISLLEDEHPEQTHCYSKYAENSGNSTVRKQTTRLKDRPISDRVLHQRRYTEDKQAYEKMFGHCYIVKESHIKTTMGYHHRPVKMAEMQHTETKCP